MCPLSLERGRQNPDSPFLALEEDKRIRVSQPLTRGPSAFIPEKEVVQANTVDERTNFLVEEYSTSGRLDNITQVMSLHAQYLESFLRSQFYMLRMDGPLPLPHRHYIAIMKLVKTGENNWSLPELVHAVVLLAHYHALASFVFGSGINPERDPEISNGFRLISVNNFCVCDLANDNSIENASLTGNNFGIVDSLSELEALMDRMKRLREEREDEEASQEEMTTRFEKEKKESLFVVSGDTFHSFPHSDFEDDMIITSDVSRYIEDPGFGYEDFARRGEEHLPTFRAQDYTWENHGFSLVNRLYSDIGHLLDEKFRMVYNLTYNTMATHEDVDTTTLRRALFNYVHCMFGIRYDDYDYGEVNQLLERSLKVYIKTVTCYPERTTKRMYDSYWRQFKHSEKVHVNLLLMEARMQAELLYALRAITRHLT
ncbi:PREDICTED: sestrin-3 isoform X3 [Odobenus rosmarus divergens]|uniref:Sestrin-3 isoform X3 n=1 Tax=Odobenus rosmarus divergens TaxID=9708 RepID=A0A2U3WT94_ODORO|nr:PREDICTED: sestrin-3 isoform X3 [Odobenus rosmarus divergens]